MEADLGFALMELPNADDFSQWNGKFSTICAIEVDPSVYVMKVNGDNGVEYWPIKWGIPTGSSKPYWMPYGKAYPNPEIAIHEAKLDMNDVLKVALRPIPRK